MTAALRLFSEDPQINPEPEPLPDPKPSRKRKSKAKEKFPLTLRKDGRYQRKVRGRVYYFGTDRDKALAQWLADKEYLLNGLTPPTETAARKDVFTLEDLCNAFLNWKEKRAEIGKLSKRQLNEYHQIAQMVCDKFGKHRAVVDIGPKDFSKLGMELAKRYGPRRLKMTIILTRAIFRFASLDDEEKPLIETPVKFGRDFVPPSADEVSRHQESLPDRMIEAKDLRTLLDAANPTMKAMILLGINCAYGPSDCGKLPISALDLDKGWVRFARNKTGVARRCPLWPETIEAIKVVLANRPQPSRPENAGLVFLLPNGNSYCNEFGTGKYLGTVFLELVRKLKIHRPGLSFYSLRHTFQTAADETGDFVAAGAITGHKDRSMAGHYRERKSASFTRRLERVVNHVRNWLFGAPADVATPSTETVQ